MAEKSVEIELLLDVLFLSQQNRFCEETNDNLTFPLSVRS